MDRVEHVVRLSRYDYRWHLKNGGTALKKPASSDSACLAGFSSIPVGGESIKIADVEYKRFWNGRLNADVLWELPNRAEVDKNFKGGQRFAVGRINDPVPSRMPSALSK